MWNKSMLAVASAAAIANLSVAMIEIPIHRRKLDKPESKTLRTSPRTFRMSKPRAMVSTLEP